MTDKPKRGRPEKPQADRHKPGRQVRIRGVFLKALDELAERLGMTPPEVVNQSLRELLQRENLWPPTADR